MKQLYLSAGSLVCYRGPITENLRKQGFDMLEKFPLATLMVPYHSHDSFVYIKWSLGCPLPNGSWRAELFTRWPFDKEQTPLGDAFEMKPTSQDCGLYCACQPTQRNIIKNIALYKEFLVCRTCKKEART
jgi:hypothetical protein